MAVKMRKLKSTTEMAKERRKKAEKKKATPDKPLVRDIEVSTHSRTSSRGKKFIVKKHSRSR